MARYGQEHKDATRRRIIEAAGRRLKRDGIDGSGIAILMADAGLTNGAFYAHFASKDDLVASVVEEELRLQAAGLGLSTRVWRASSSSSAPTCPPSTAITPPQAAHRPPCSTRSGGLTSRPDGPTPPALGPSSTRSHSASHQAIRAWRTDWRSTSSA